MIRRQLDRGGGDQPDPLPGVEVHLGQRPGARPDPVGHQLVVDLLAERGDLRDRTAGDERQRGVAAGGGRVRGLPAADPELDLLPGEPEQVGGGEELAGGEPAGEVEDRRADHHRVVDVEERGGGEVGERTRRRGRSSPAATAAAADGLAGPDGRVAAVAASSTPGVSATPATRRTGGRPGSRGLVGVCWPPAGLPRVRDRIRIHPTCGTLRRIRGPVQLHRPSIGPGPRATERRQRAFAAVGGASGCRRLSRS